MVKKLDLFGNETSSGDIIKFDQAMGLDGKWNITKNQLSTQWAATRRLDNFSNADNSDWEYYFCQDEDGRECLYRKKKK